MAEHLYGWTGDSLLFTRGNATNFGINPFWFEQCVVHSLLKGFIFLLFRRERGCACFQPISLGALTWCHREAETWFTRQRALSETTGVDLESKIGTPKCKEGGRFPLPSALRDSWDNDGLKISGIFKFHQKLRAGGVCVGKEYESVLLFSDQL